jgi:hypothetical protein
MNCFSLKNNKYYRARFVRGRMVKTCLNILSADDFLVSGRREDYQEVDLGPISFKEKFQTKIKKPLIHLSALSHSPQPQLKKLVPYIPLLSFVVIGLCGTPTLQ